MSKQGQTGFNLMFFKKGLWMGAGQMKVKAYSLCNLAALGKAKPSFIVSHWSRLLPHLSRNRQIYPFRSPRFMEARDSLAYCHCATLAS